jgi:hypothetical protein
MAPTLRVPAARADRRRRTADEYFSLRCRGRIKGEQAHARPYRDRGAEALRADGERLGKGDVLEMLCPEQQCAGACRAPEVVVARGFDRDAEVVLRRERDTCLRRASAAGMGRRGAPRAK